MSTQIAEPPPTQNSNVAQPLPSSRQAGMVPIADALVAAQKGAPVTPTAEVEVRAEEIRETLPTRQSLLAGIETAKEAAKETVKETKMSETAAKHFELVKGERDTFKAEAEKLRSEALDAAKLKAELEELRPKVSRVTELEQKLEETAFERSDKYQNLVRQQDEMVTSAKDLAKEFEVDPSVIDRALASKGKKRLDLLETTFADSPTAAARFERILAEVDRVDGIKAAEMKAYRERLEKMGAEEARRAIESENETKAEVMRAFDAVLPKISEKLPYFKEVAGDDAHNASVKSDLEMARKIIGGEAPLEDQVTAPYLAVIAKRLISRNNGLETENAQLKERLAKYNGNTPGLTSGATDSVPAANQKMGMMEAYKARS